MRSSDQFRYADELMQLSAKRLGADAGNHGDVAEYSHYMTNLRCVKILSLR